MITLFLMTIKGYRVLDKIIESGYKEYIQRVVIGIDKNISNDFSNEILEKCKVENINAVVNQSILTSVNSFDATYALAVSWRWLIKIPENGQLIVLHDSLLPKYRGFSPLVNQLINGEKEIGVSALYATENYDEGNIIYQSKTQIEYPITIFQAIDKIVNNYIDIALYILGKLAKNEEIAATPQDHSLATYSLWRDDQDYRINWNDDSDRIQRFIDAVGFPYKGAYCFLNNIRVSIMKVSIVEDKFIENRDIGKIIFIKSGKPVVVCKKGLLLIEESYYEDGNSIFPLKKFRSRFS